MPQVGLAIAGIASSFAASGAGTFLTTTVLGKFLASTALSLTMTALSAALTDKPTSEQGGISTNVTTSGANVTRKFILGTYATSGHAITPPYNFGISKSNREYLLYVIDISDARIDGVIEWIVDGETYQLEPKRNPGDSGFKDKDAFGRSFDGKLSRYGFVELYKGDQTSVSSVLLSHLGGYPERPITADMKMTGVAYAVMTFILDQDEDHYSGMPDVRFVVRGKPLYDPRKDSTNGGTGTHRWGQENTYEFSDNPIVMAYNLFRGISLSPTQVYGVMAPAKSLPNSYWFAAMNHCDEAGTQPSGPEWWKDLKRYRAGFEIDVGVEPLTNIEEILKACGGLVAEVGGEYIITVGSPSAPVVHITDGVILSDHPREYNMYDGLSNSFNYVTGSYPDPRNLWEETDAAPIENLLWEAEDDGRRLTAAIKFPTVPYPAQVRRLMREISTDNRRKRTHTIVLPAPYMGLNPTENITWTSPKNGYNNKVFEVIRKVIDSKTLSVVLTIRERNPADYDFNAVSDLRTPTIPSSVTVVPTIDGVDLFDAEAVVINDAMGRPRRPAIKLTWNPSANYDSIRYQVKVKDTNQEVNYGSIIDTTLGVLYVADMISPRETYLVRAVGVVEGIGSSSTIWSDWIEVTTHDVRTTREDLEDDLIQDLEDLVTGLDTVDDTVAAIDQRVISLRAELDATVLATQNDLVLVRDEIDSNVDDLNKAIANTKSELLGNLATLNTTIRQDMGEAITTGINSHDVVLQGQLSSIVGQIDELTAALTSTNLIDNGDFATGTKVGWTSVGTSTVEPKATSALALAQSAPAANSLRLNFQASISQVSKTFILTSLDVFKIRFAAAGSSATATDRNLIITATWRDADGVAIGSAVSVTVSVASNAWTFINHTFEPPFNAKSVALTFKNNGAAGYQMLTLLQGNTSDSSIEAQIVELRAAQANTSSSLAAFSLTANTRFGQNETAIGTEIVNRTTADDALGLRINTVESTANTNKSKISSIETTVANTITSIASLDTKIEAKFNGVQLVRDPEFVSSLDHWTGALGMLGNLINRDKASNNWVLRDMPGAKAFKIDNAAAGSRQSNTFDVSPSESYDLGFYAGKTLGGPIGRVILRWMNNSNIKVGNDIPLDVDPVVGAYQYFYKAEAVPPLGAVKGAVIFQRLSDGTGTGSVYITGITNKRRAATDYQSTALLSLVSSSVANTSLALTNYIQSANTRFELNESNLSDEITNRTDAVSAITIRLSSVESKAANNSVLITGLATTVANTVTSIAEVSDRMTSVFGDSQLVRDPDFNSGLTYWNPGSLGTEANIISRNKSSTSWFLRDMPGRKAFFIENDMSGARPSPFFDASPSEFYGMGFYAGRATGGPSIKVYLQWVDAAGASIGSNQIDITPVVRAYQYYSLGDGVQPPMGAVQGRVVFQRLANGTAGARTYLTNITSKKASAFDSTSAASIESLKITVANNELAFTTYKNSANTRFGLNETAITTETTNRSKADDALAIRIDKVEATANTNKSTITTQAATLANATESLAQLSEKVTSVFGSVQMVRDPDFGSGLAHWGGTLGDATNLIKRDPNHAHWTYNSIPGRAAFVISGTDTGSRTSPYFDASPAENYDISFFAGRGTDGPTVRAYIQYLNKDNASIGGSLILDVTPSVGGYTFYSKTDSKPPAGTVKARLVFQRLGAGTSNSYVTGFEIKRQSAFEQISKADIATLQTTLATATSSLASLTLSTNAEFGRVTAGSKFRVYSTANGSGGVSRIGLTAEAEDQSKTTAGLFLEAKSDGTSSVYVDARRFAIATSSAVNAPRSSPFFVVGDDTYISNAFIRDGDITNAKIGNVIQSDNFISGEGGRGWRIHKSGNAEFNSIKIRRQIAVASGSYSQAGFGTTVSDPNGGGATFRQVSRIIETNIPFADWLGSEKTYLAVAGMSGGGVSGSASNNTFWGYDTTVHAYTRWFGPQFIRIKITWYSTGVSSVQPHTVHWKLYEVS